MPARGEFYSHVEVACDKWAKDWLVKTGKRQADLARMLGVVDRFVHDLVNGRINTLKTLEIIVEKAGGGNYLIMGQYALTDEGLETLKDMQFRKKLSPLERDQYSRLRDLALKCMKKHGDFDKLIEVCEAQVLKMGENKE